MPKRLLSGKVISSNSNKTIVVEVTRRVKHKLYKKIIKKVKKYHAHDETNAYKIGDIVTIQESKPISKMKTWIRPTGMPCLILIDENMNLQIHTLRGIGDAINEVYNILDLN